MRRLITPSSVVLAALAAAAVWVICSVIPKVAAYRAFAAAAALLIVTCAHLVRARGVPAPAKAIAVAIMAISSVGLYFALASAVAGFLLTLGKWPALAIHFAGGMIQAVLVLTLRRAGLVIAWRKKAEAKLSSPFWQGALKWGTFPACVLASLFASPILTAFIPLIAGVSQRLTWIYVTVAVAITSASMILGGDELGLGQFFSTLQP